MHRTSMPQPPPRASGQTSKKMGSRRLLPCWRACDSPRTKVHQRTPVRGARPTTACPLVKVAVFQQLVRQIRLQSDCSFSILLYVSALSNISGHFWRPIERLVSQGRFIPPLRLGRKMMWHREKFTAWLANGANAAGDASESVHLVSGGHPRNAQALARHSTIDLAMNIYTHICSQGPHRNCWY
jgi:hypothetical protein